MLDKKTEMMLSVANLLTAEDLDEIRASAQAAVADIEMAEAETPVVAPPDVESGAPDAELDSPANLSGGMTPGERERRRTRESKIATQCAGSERPKHDWWPIGTELVGQIGPEIFTALVVENPQVKSSRSIKITSGPAAGRICITSTRAALEATEAYRQAHNLGRSGGVTNGWTFWKPRE